MEELLEKMKYAYVNQSNLSQSAIVRLCEDTDTRTLVIDRSKRVCQLSSYQECNGVYYNLKQYQ